MPAAWFIPVFINVLDLTSELMLNPISMPFSCVSDTLFPITCTSLHQLILIPSMDESVTTLFCIQILRLRLDEASLALVFMSTSLVAVFALMFDTYTSMQSEQ